MTDTAIRTARTDDAATLTAIVAAAYAPFADLDGLPDVTSGLAGDIAQRAVLVAEAGAVPVGVAVLSVQGGAAHLVNLAVLPDAAGTGLGSRLVAAAEARASQAGATVIRLATHAAFGHALALYRRLGWVETGRDGVKVTMEKRL